jgi:competence protein ComEA
MKISKFFGALLMTFALNAWAAVDINTASVADLDSIKGIGPGTSAKILEQRKAGKFKDWADVIQRVTGIGEIRAGKLSKEGLTVNGAAYKPSASTKSEATATKAKKP